MRLGPQKLDNVFPSCARAKPAVPIAHTACKQEVKKYCGPYSEGGDLNAPPPQLGWTGRGGKKAGDTLFGGAQAGGGGGFNY